MIIYFSKIVFWIIRTQFSYVGTLVGFCPCRNIRTQYIKILILQRIAEMTELLEAREQKLIEMNQTNVDLQESNSDLKRYTRFHTMLGLLFQINCIVVL
jgi:hypothetical protein